MDNTLVFQIVRALSNASGGAHAPSYGDSLNRLLFKWAQLVNL